MKKNCYPLFFPALMSGMACLLLTFCLMACKNDKPAEPSGETPQTEKVPPSVETVPQPHEDRGTIYGISEGFGMGSFTLRDTNGNVYEVTLTDEATGAYGDVYGDRVEGARYAMTLNSDSTAVRKLFNLSQLDKFTKDYYFVDGRLVLTSEGKSEEVTVNTLDNHCFKATGKSGHVYEFNL